MSKNNAKIIANYINNQKIKMQSKMETAQASKQAFSWIAGTCAGLSIPFSIMPDQLNRSTGAGLLGAGALYGSCALVSYLVEKHRRNKCKDLAHLSELTEEVVNDYNCIEATINTAKRGCSNEDILESLSPLAEIDDNLENQMVLEKF